MIHTDDLLHVIVKICYSPKVKTQGIKSEMCLNQVWDSPLHTKFQSKAKLMPSGIVRLVCLMFRHQTQLSSYRFQDL